MRGMLYSKSAGVFDSRLGTVLCLPVLSDGRAGVRQSQKDLHVALLFRVATHPRHEPLNSAVLRLEAEMR